MIQDLKKKKVELVKIDFGMLHIKKGLLLFFMFQKSMNGIIKVVSTSNDSSDSSSNRDHHLNMKKRRKPKVAGKKDIYHSKK